LNRPSDLRRWQIVTCLMLAVSGWACRNRVPSSKHDPGQAPAMRELQEERKHSPSASTASIVLRDVTKESGITFVHTDGGSGEYYIVEAVSAGLALFDYDGDGDIDIYFLNGAPLRGTVVDSKPGNALYRNDGGLRFTDVTNEAGLGDTGYGLGVSVADYDGDGDPDVYLNNYGPNRLYENNSDGTFSDVTIKAGLENGHKVGAGVAFLDIEGDGDLDLYVANYVGFTYDTHLVTSRRGFPEYTSPLMFEPEADTIYRNNGDGTFTDVGVASGVAAHAGTGMGLVCADHDADGDTDVFVLNDVAGNCLFENDGSGKFEEVAVLVGLAYDYAGEALGSMGVDCGDYDNDGSLDFFMTSYQNQMPILYKNLGDGFYEDVTFRTGAGAGSLPYVNWGTGLVDFDNDGDRDIFLACGHLQDKIDLYDGTTAYRNRNILLMNDGKGNYVDVSNSSGDGMLPEFSSRGAGFDDLDNDGDIDVVILNSREAPTILENESTSDNHWIQIQLVGVRSNRDGVGAQVRIIAGDLSQVDEVHSGRGYQSHYGTRLHFGLSDQSRVDRIEVRWLGGDITVLGNVPVDQLVTIIEDPSQRQGERGHTSP